jgi:hypothetical protein
MDPKMTTMALREPTRRQRRRPQPQRPQPRPKKDDDLPVLPDDDEVLTFAQWCKSISISTRTGRILKAGGRGPVFTKVSDKRIGVTRRNNRIWLRDRAQPKQRNTDNT